MHQVIQIYYSMLELELKHPENMIADFDKFVGTKL